MDRFRVVLTFNLSSSNKELQGSPTTSFATVMGKLELFFQTVLPKLDGLLSEKVVLLRLSCQTILFSWIALPSTSAQN